MILKRGAFVTAVGLALTCATSARADRAEEIRACAQSHERGQVLRKSGKLVDASAELQACAKPVCPAEVRGDCGTWLGEVEASVPTVVVVTRKADGSDAADARIFLDGRELPAADAARALPIDPGAHVARAEHPGDEVAEQSFVVHEGEKLRTIQLVFGATSKGDAAGDTGARPPAQSSVDDRGAPVLGWVFVGIGGAALATAGVLFVKQSLDYDALESTCKPSCDRDDARSIDTTRLVAGVVGGVGVVAATAGVVMLLSAPSRSDHARRSPRLLVGIGGAALRMAFD